MGPNQIRSNRLNYLLKKFLHNPNITVYESALAMGVTKATARDYEKVILSRLRRDEQR